MIYFFENYDGFDCEKYLHLLDEKRREKYNRLKQKRDKENCVISYLLLKKALADFGVTDPEIITGENGKPFLKNNESVCFNLSHTGSGVAVIVDEKPVGIDIQDILPVRNGVVERCFSQAEKQLLENSHTPERDFTRLWTLKESAVKFSGETIASLNKFCFADTEKSFEKYGRKFTTLERKNLFISVCGKKVFSMINEIKSLEEII